MDSNFDKISRDATFDFLSYEDKKKGDYQFIDDHIKMITSHYDVDYLAKTKKQIRDNYMIGNGMSPLHIHMNNPRQFHRQPGSDDSVASTINYYDIQRKVLTRMWGENQKRQLSSKVMDISGYNQNVRKMKTLELYQGYIRETIFAPVEQQATMEVLQKYGIEDPSQLPPEEQDQFKNDVEQTMKFKLPSDIDKYMKNTYISPSEAQLAKLIQFCKVEFGIKFLTSETYKDLTLAGYEAVYMGIRDNRPVIEQINPEYFTFFNPTSSPFIEDSDWWINERNLTFPKLVRDYLNTGDKIKEFKDFVDKYDFSKIKSGQASWGATKALHGAFNSVNMRAGFIDESGNLSYLPDVSSPEGQKFYERVETLFGSNSPNQKNMYTAKHVVFTSFDKLYYVEREDPKNRTRLKGFWVGENYSKNNRLDIRVTEKWFPALYEGVELGPETGYICNKQRVPFQNRSVNNPAKLFSPFVGVEFSKLQGNTPRIAPVDLGKAIAYKANLLENKIQELDESNMGRIFTFANQAVPENWTIEQVIEVAKKSKFVPIDLTRLGELGFSQVAGQLFKSVDVSNDDYIENYTRRKEILERECMEAMSYSPSQMGTAPASITATANQQNVIQGSYATEDINYIHRMFEERVLEAFANLVRNGLRTNDYIRSYLLDELGIAQLELDEELLDLAEIFIKITSDLEDVQDINAMKSYIQPMIQNKLVNFHEVAMLQFSKEPSAVLNMSREAQERLNKAQRDQEEKQFQLEQEKLKLQRELAKKEDAYRERDFQLRELDIKMRGDQFRLQADSDNNKVPDTVQKSVIDNEYEMDRLQYQTESDKDIKIRELDMELEKLRNEMKVKEKELELKAREIEVKARQKSST
jgi:hypothetical protein